MALKRFLILIPFLLLTGSVTSQVEDSRMSQAWILGSNLGVAAALHSQAGDNSTLVEQRFLLASKAATTFGLKLPPIPAKKGIQIDDSSAMLFYLMGKVGKPVGGVLSKDYGAEYATVFDVAIRANALLIVYGSDEETTGAIASVIKARSSEVSFLASLTDQLRQKVDQRASYDVIKKEIFELNRIAPQFIALVEFSRDGQTKYSSGDYVGSAAAYTKGLVVNPSDIESYNGRGRAYLKLKKNSEAIADYTNAIKIGIRDGDSKSNLGLSYTNRGIAYLLVGNYDLALADLTKAISLRPEHAGAYKARSVLYKQMGNATLSAADLKKAGQLEAGIKQ